MSMNFPVVLNAELTLQLPLDGVKLIEASAGTGKTYAISNLYLRYVLNGCKVSEILVVTFTNAATEELRGRIRARLHETLRAIQQWLTGTPAEPVQDEFLQVLLQSLESLSLEQVQQSAARLSLAVRTMEEAAIYTINGFCQRALTDHAFSSGQAFDLELISDDDALWQDALKDWWRSTAYDLDDVQVNLLTSSLGSFSAFLQLQKPLRFSGPREVLPGTADDMYALHEKWRGLAEPLGKLALEWQKRSTELQVILLESAALSRTQGNGYKPDDLRAAFARLDAYFQSQSLLEFSADLVLLSADNLRSNNKPSKIDTDADLQDSFFLCCQAVVDDAKSLRERFVIAALLDATRDAHARMERAKALTQTITFSDQLTRLHDALLRPSGATLAQTLRHAFPVAMIDEFQDTDTIQYRIFHQLYGQELMENAGRPGALIMIGDPKQAIYSFRGGDIFAYAEARRDAGSHRYTLDTNWRSVPTLVAAVNTFFLRHPAPFIYADAIDFMPVQAADKMHKPLLEAGEAVTPFTLWQIPAAADGKLRNKGEMDQLISNCVADEIARLINAGRNGEVTLGDAALQPGDIAVLVRTNFEGAGVRAALLARGVSAVTVGRDKVFQCEEARALELLLSAIVHCTDRRALRAALSSALLALDYVQIAQVVDNQQQWLLWAERMRSLHALWQQKGFMVMFHSLLQETLATVQIGLQIATGPLAERRLTNLLHLAELLQQVARTHPGLESLMTWFREQIADTSDAETELRLESDEALVKIVTIHASKGLEYPVVFAPFLWVCKPRDKDRAARDVVAFHDANGVACLDLGSSDFDRHLLLAEKERLAEDVRLAYVALTRARARIYLLWGKVGTTAYSDRSALAWLLHAEADPQGLDQEKTDQDKLDEQFVSVSLEEPRFSAQLQALVAASAGAIEVVPMPLNSHSTLVPSTAFSSVQLQPAQFRGSIATDWRISSFSSLTRDIHQAAHGGSKGMSTDPILNFAAGSRVGLFLHKILEELDFQGDIAAQVIRLNKVHARDYNFDAERQQDTVVSWLQNIVHTALTAEGFTLAHLPRQRRLDELEFDFAIDTVSVVMLNDVLSKWAGAVMSPVGVDDFRGMITGIIDLVFEHDGRFYIADYKSNFLGTTLADYAPQNLRQAIFDRRYDLQYLLYVLALHRYLRQRLRGYDYVQHMGGVFYLFLRGMRPATGAQYGVYHDLPPLALIEQLDTNILGCQGMARQPAVGEESA